MTDLVCAQCGHRNAAGSNYCSSCGASLRHVREEHTGSLPAADLVVDPSDDEFRVDRDAIPPGGAVLVVKRGPSQGMQFPIGPGTRSVAAGRHPRSDVFLDDITVSRRHAEVRRTDDGGWVLRDVGSLNGTYLNHERIDEAALTDGDEVQVGKFKLVFVTRRGQ